MIRLSLLFASVALLVPAMAAAEPIKGDYLESRTCDIYTGPCFANAQVGLAGMEAIQAWKIKEGAWNGVNLAGTSVIVGVKASDTLGWGGGLKFNPYPIKSMVIVDEKVTSAQRDALVSFVKSHAAKSIGDVVKVTSLPIDMTVDHFRQVGKLDAGNAVHLLTRKMGEQDCVCTNEMIFYPPLVQLRSYRPAYIIEGSFAATGLGTHWSNPSTRSGFLASFSYEANKPAVSENVATK